MTHLKFVVIEEKPKTKVYGIYSIHDYFSGHKLMLGEIYWWGKWRQYIFEPNTYLKTIWSEDCLEEVYEFLKKLKEERKRK